MTNTQSSQFDHLVLLVSKKPLQNYISAKLLLKPHDHLYLVCTDETYQFATRLVASLRLGIKQVTYIQVKEEDGYKAFEEALQYVNCKGDVCLNYTGGTNTMAIHTYRAIAKHCPDIDVALSCLDSKTMRLWVEKPGAPVKLYSVPFQINLDIETLLGMNGYRVQKKPTDLFDSENITRALENIEKNPKGWAGWCSENSTRDGKSQSENNMWLKRYTFWSLQRIAEESGIHDTAVDVVPAGFHTYFSIDIVAMKGYRPYAIFCVADNSETNLIGQMMLNYHRVRKILDDEVRVGLVCCSPSDSPSNPSRIESELKKTLNINTRDTVRVFGAEHLPILADLLKDWIKNS